MSTPSAAGVPESADAPAKAGAATLVGLILAVAMTSIDQTIVALSAPTIQNDLGITHDAVQWAVNVYLLTTAAFFLLGGRLADVLGHKRMLIVGTAGFGLTSLLCGLAPTGDAATAWLIVFRALQGVAGAIMFPAALGILVQTFPKQGRARAMATFFTVTGFMTAIGPIAGGYLTAWTWRSIFWVNVPIAIAALIVVIVTAKRTPRRRESIDWAGAGIIALGMGLIVFGFQQASAWGWGSVGVWGSLVVGVALVLLFALFERRQKQPLVKLQIFRDRGFTLAVLATMFASIAFISTFFFQSVYGQVSLGLSAENTGLQFFKFFIGFVIAARIGSRMFDKQGAKAVLAIGGALGALGFGWLAVIATDLDFHANDFFNPQLWPILVAGAGVGFMFSAASADAVNRSIGASYGEVTAISQTMRNFGGAFGLAIFSTLVTNQLVSSVTASIEKLGGTAAQANQAVASLSGATGGGSALSNVPAQLRDQIVSALQHDYAAAVQWAFYGMAGAMAVLIVLAAFYPSAKPDPERSMAAMEAGDTETSSEPA